MVLVFSTTPHCKIPQIRVRNWNYLERDAMEVSTVSSSCHQGAPLDRFLLLKRRLSGMRFMQSTFGQRCSKYKYSLFITMLTHKSCLDIHRINKNG